MIITDYCFIRDTIAMQCFDYFLELNRHMDNRILQIYNVGYDEMYANYTYGYDQRDYYLMEFIIKGKSQLEIDNMQFTLSDDNAYIILPHKTFRRVAEGEGTTCWIGFIGENIQPFLDNLGAVKGYPVFRYQNKNIILTAVEQLYQSAHNPNISNATLTGLFFTLLGRIIDSNNEKGAFSYKALSHYDKARQYIDAHIYSELTVSELCSIFEISQPQLYRSFMSNCQISPIEYINRAKMKCACNLIANSDFSYHQIATMLGYKYDATFYSKFHKYVKMKPSEYRRLKHQ